LNSELQKFDAGGINLQRVRALYDRYAGMLLGYITEVIKDSHEAEQLLIRVFSDLHQQLDDMDRSALGAFCYLQLHARKKIAVYLQNTGNQAPAIRSNKYLNLLSEEQLKVFCGLHYDGKNSSILAFEMGKTPEAIRLILKEAFGIIRKGRSA